MASTYEVSQLARTLMNEHGLGAWRFEFDKASKRFGVCKYGLRVIGLSEKLVRANTLDRCRETILHEIAHALAGSQARSNWSDRTHRSRAGRLDDRRR